jgi:RNA polymerase sigma factor (sigma-70 family)
MPLLQRPWQLHDVKDVEALAWKVVAAARFQLRPHERDDLCTFLIETIWQASTSYDATRSSSFSTFAYTLARQRAVDWHRKERGRSRWQFKGRVHERQLPVFVSLDADGELGGSLGGRPLAATTDRAPDLARALRERSRPPAGYQHEMGETAA